MTLKQTAVLRVALTLLLAWAAAALCVRLRTPLPWMIGPLLATALVSMLGGPTASWTPLRNAGQWIIGGALGLYFTPQVVALVAGLWWAIALNIVWALAVGLLFGAWLHRVHSRPGVFHVAGLSRITTYFAAPIGAASEMTLLGER
ncbi:AbrB family transcriptional regulator, partial [Polaromonas sp.]|uniref:AbrB family transcriptional regulator n=1 Tax=Polaromonas sp. TaxID=1869339 RepID=UPI00286AC719